MVGEMGESHHAIRMMGEYTTGKRLHKAYSFEMLGDRFDAAHFRGQIEEFFAGAPGGWPSWAFSNHDVRRHVTRWAKHGIGREPLAKLAGALLLSLEGSICIYQGEELGQTETELEYHELTDPQGIRFWPEDKGRDGCRTPMAWDAAEPNAGFSTGTPLAADQGRRRRRNAVAGQLGQPDSVLEFYRAMLRLRRETEELRTGRTASSTSPSRCSPSPAAARVLCVFNLSPETHRVRLTGGGAMALAQGAEHGGDGTLTLHPNGFAIMEAAAAVEVSDAPAGDQPEGERQPKSKLPAVSAARSKAASVSTTTVLGAAGGAAEVDHEARVRVDRLAPSPETADPLVTRRSITSRRASKSPIVSIPLPSSNRKRSAPRVTVVTSEVAKSASPYIRSAPAPPISVSALHRACT